MAVNLNLSRLLKLIRKQWIENARIYLLSTLALAGILSLVFIFWLFNGSLSFNEETLYVIFTIGLYIGGVVFASMSFNMLTDKRKGVYWLGFPASHLEKLLTVIFFNLVVFTVVYSLCFYLIKTLAVSYLKGMMAANPLYSYHLADSGGFMEVFPNFLYGFVAIQAFYVLGSIYFSRFTFIMTTVIGIALVFIFMWFTISLINNNIPDGFKWDGFYVKKYEGDIGTDGGFYKYQLPALAFSTLLFLLKFIWAPVFWLITYFRLKEKEI